MSFHTVQGNHENAIDNIKISSTCQSNSAVKKRTTENFTFFLFYLQWSGERQNSAKFISLSLKIQKKDSLVTVDELALTY